MFRIEIMCDDKKLADCLRAVMGLALGQPNVMPVVNASMSNGQIRANGNGNAVALFEQYLRDHKIAEVNSSVAAAFLQSVGRKKGSASYMLQQGVKHGILRKSGKDTKGNVYATQQLLPPPKTRKKSPRHAAS